MLTLNSIVAGARQSDQEDTPVKRFLTLSAVE
jgi:hypothetical protein